MTGNSIPGTKVKQVKCKILDVRALNLDNISQESAVKSFQINSKNTRESERIFIRKIVKYNF